MMTSVTLPSSSAPIHSGFPSANVGGEPPPPTTAQSQPASAATDGEHEFEAPRPVKRSLPPSSPQSPAALSTTATYDASCKKRRKQSTPVRISAAESPPAPSPELELSCPICQLAFGAPDQLAAHLATEHVSAAALKTEPEEAPAAGKQPDLPWLPEMPNKEWMNPSNLLPFPGPNHMFMGLPAAAYAPQETMPPRQPIRIFNPDAYCELCNKEFCNKYFLKTHKANKHGIYTDPPPTSDAPVGMGPSVSIPSFGNKLAPSTLPMDLGAVKIEPKSYPEMFSSFANKLFNKAVMGKTPSNTSFFEGDPQENSSTNGAVHNTNENGGSDEPQPHHQQQQQQIQQPVIADESSNSRINLTETTSITLKQELVQDYQQPPQQPVIPQSQPQLPGQPAELFYTSPSKLSPGQQREQQQRELDLSIRYRRIGVMNPKAFCEICCKEYCNKYFLRTHKMKRHGIYIPDDRDKDNVKMEMMGGSMQYPQTSPLNLIMNEQSSNSSDRKTSSPSDVSCESCGIKFQNMSLYQLHNVSVHAKLPTTMHEQAASHLQTNTTLPSSTSHTPDDKKEYGDKSQTQNPADSISEDLQKLQTMILQLNDLESNKTPNSCGTCNKEFENRYFLHAHMMTEHGILLDENQDQEKAQDADDANINNNTMCDLCGKDFPNSEDMKKHIYEAHKPNTQSQPASIEDKAEFNGFPPPEKLPRNPNFAQPDRKTSMSMTPTSSYCEICNKELCNKYFMKTHMQRMHGIEIENGAQIGGVVCDICNKELCSKYFLRVHKHNTHGIVEYGSNLLQPRKFEEQSPTTSGTATPQTSEDSALKPSGDLADLSHRYFTHFTEVCMLCSRRFRSTKWLKAHLLSDHGQVGAEKWAELEQQLQLSMVQNKGSSGKSPNLSIKVPINSGDMQQQQKLGIQNVLSSIFGADEAMAKTYQCSYCPFTTPVLPFLFVHERSHVLMSENSSGNNSGNGPSGTPTPTNAPNANLEGIPLKCPVCMQTFTQPEQLQHHVFSQHPFLPLPPFFNGFNGLPSSESPGEGSKEPSESADDAEDVDKGSMATTPTTSKTSKKVVVSKRKPIANRIDMMPQDMDETLKDMARKSQLPATYALPQVAAAAAAVATANDEDSTSEANPTQPYVMQAFLLEEQLGATGETSSAPSSPTEAAKFMPSIVFLPVVHKLSAPLTATFTLTPA